MATESIGARFSNLVNRFKGPSGAGQSAAPSARGQGSMNMGKVAEAARSFGMEPNGRAGARSVGLESAGGPGRFAPPEGMSKDAWKTMNTEKKQMLNKMFDESKWNDTAKQRMGMEIPLKPMEKGSTAEAIGTQLGKEMIWANKFPNSPPTERQQQAMEKHLDGYADAFNKRFAGQEKATVKEMLDFTKTYANKFWAR